VTIKHKDLNYFEYAYSESVLKKILWSEVIRHLRPFLGITSDRVLEIGSGHGEFINQIKAREKHAVDLLHPTKNTLDKEVIFHEIDLTKNKLDFNVKFDLIFSSNMLEHIDLGSVHSVVEQMEMLLDDHGSLVLVGPNFKTSYKHYFDDPTHVTALSHTTLILIAKKFGLIPRKVIPKFLPYTMQSSLGGPQFLERYPIMAKFLLRLYLTSPVRPFSGQFALVFTKPIDKVEGDAV
jgi:2-polyprenyl-3-methyl-5-hydroxy-6-metoxy-1,4-benzoquinol methylase